MSEANFTPYTNRGVTCGSDKENPYLTALIDWCQITVHDVSPENIADDILQIPYRLMKNDLRGGIKGYSSMMCFDDIRILEGGLSTSNEGSFQILMAGQGCRNFEKFLEAREETWFDFFERVLEYNVNFPRIDLAIDDRKTYFKIPKLIQLAKNGFAVSKLRSGERHDAFKLKDGEHRGATLNFGSRSSEFFMAFYEKNYERAEAFESEDIGESWNRYELRFRQKRAVNLVHELVKRKEVFSIAMEILNEYLKFVKRPVGCKETRTRDLPLWEPWAWFMQDVKKLNLYMKPEAKNYFSMLNWIRVSVAPTLLILKTVDDILGTNELESLIENAKLTPKHEALLEDCVNQALGFLELGISFD